MDKGQLVQVSGKQQHHNSIILVHASHSFATHPFLKTHPLLHCSTKDSLSVKLCENQMKQLNSLMCFCELIQPLITLRERYLCGMCACRNERLLLLPTSHKLLSLSSVPANGQLTPNPLMVEKEILYIWPSHPLAPSFIYYEP